MKPQLIQLPQVANDTMKRYFSLDLGNKKVVCPYYMNLKKTKDLRAMVGKGTPVEIEMEARIWEKLKGVSFSAMTKTEIREFLIHRGIGIDCSGFVMHVMNEWYRSEKHKSIWMKMKPMKKGIVFRIAYFLKSVEKLGAEIITNTENSECVEIVDVLPGDLIRTKWKRKNSHHVLLISEVKKDTDGKVKEITYVNAAEFYGSESGMRTGKIIITDEHKPLETQTWEDFDENGVNHIFEGYQYQVTDNGIRRLKAMKKLIEANGNK